VNVVAEIRKAESRLHAVYELDMDESYLELPSARLRVISTGTGPPLVLLHGVGLAAAAWIPLIPALDWYRVHVVDLPGHGLSSPATFLPGAVREPVVRLLDELFDALDVAAVPVVGHSLGGMFALWYASQRPGRISSLIAIGDPAVALPGAIVRMPLSVMTVRILGPLFLRAPTPRPLYRYLLGQGLGRSTAAAVPGALLDVLRLSIRRPGNPESVASLMHALNHFRHPRTGSVMNDTELHQVTSPTMFIWGQDDPFLSPSDGRPAIAQLPSAVLHEVAGGHGPWLDDPERCAGLVKDHLINTAYPPTVAAAALSEVHSTSGRDGGRR
jgi:pimeloyl-ACP methyl ester carboxylesterase